MAATFGDKSTLDEAYAYMRERQASAVHSFKGTPPPDEDLVNHHGAGLQEGSRAAATHEVIKRIGSRLHQHLNVQWMYDVAAGDHALRISDVACSMHPQDQRAGPVQRALVASRQLWYSVPANAVHLPTVKKAFPVPAGGPTSGPGRWRS